MSETMTPGHRFVSEAVECGLLGELHELGGNIDLLIREESDKACESIKRELLRPWMVVYLDGRNEHGSHVLPMPGSMMLDGPDENALHEDAEQIISEAEAAGHSIGHCVVTMWRSVEYDECRVWEYESYHADLTAIFCGTPHEQRQELERIDADFQNATVSS